MAAERADYTVTQCCRALRVSPSGCYAWQQRPESARARRDRQLRVRTYACEDYRVRLEQHGITCSMSRRGNCYDNAVMESWFSTVKSEEGDADTASSTA